ncbi:MAG TPA: M1 family aminopeptidase, partial [Planctomycetota bacterium]|nr:M1 family aminopeptidase [Planctomycetota bacterium]
WFDDLWLKEGFATFMGYKLMAALEPERHAWLAFHRRIKPRAYEIDASPGTTPIWQALANLADAKSAYGAIVYNKAPAVLRELEARLSPERFRAGVRAFLHRYAWRNATWQDLVAELERAAGHDLASWSRAWILTEGLPRVRAEWTVGSNGRILGFSVRQERTAGGGKAQWPLRVRLLAARGGEHATAEVRLEGERAAVPEFVGREAFDWVILNPADEAYGLFLLDPRSAGALLATLPEEGDPMVRAVALSALRETMRAGELDPLAFGDLLLRLLERERDPEAHAVLLDALQPVVLRYLEPERAAPLRARAEELLVAQLDAGIEALAVQVFRALARLASTPEARARIARAVERQALPGGVALGAQDTWLGLAALIAAGAAGDLRARVPKTGDVAKYVYLAEAATPTAESKERYFASYLDPAQPPEQWVQQSLPFFHWPGQEELTQPFLRRALDRVDWVKVHRKIFFMPAWIDGFVNGHSSAEALAVVEEFLAARPDLAPDIRKKVLQSLDELRRVVAIRARWR